MLMLLFQLGNSRYAIPAREVIEVAAMVNLENLPKAPDYRQHVPVLDLCRLINNQPCSNLITSRMILVEFPLATGGTRTLGLLAERVTETLQLDDQGFSDTGISIPDAPFIGRATHTEQGLVQQLSVTELLPADVQAQLYPAEAG